jgi:hypothetical protein
MKFRYLRPISDLRYNLSILSFIVLYHWKSVIDVERIAILPTPVIIQMKEKCVQNAISLFIGLLTIITTRFLNLNSMNWATDSIFGGLARASEHGLEVKIRKKVEYFNLS